MRQTGQTGFEFGWVKRPDYFSLFNAHQSLSLKLRCLHDPHNTFTPPPELKEIWASQLHDLHVEIEKKQLFFPGPVARLLTANMSTDSNKLEITTGKASYYDYRVSYELLKNKSYETNGDIDCRLTKNLKNEYSLKGFNNTSVCGGLGVEIAIVTSDPEPKIIITKRSEECGYLRNLFLASIGESIHPGYDKGGMNGKNCFLEPLVTVKRGLKEELGFEIEPEQIEFFNLGVHIPTMDPDLLGMIKVPYRASDILAISKNAKDYWEMSEIRFINFSPKIVADFIRNVGVQNMTPAAPICLIFSLQRDFEKEDVLQAFSV